MVDVSKPAGERITITGFTSGSPFENEKNYHVALNSYRGSGGGGHLTSGSGLSEDQLPERIISSTARDLRFHMMEWMKNQKIIEPAPYDNWTVIPHVWWMEGKERDRKILFPFEQ